MAEAEPAIDVERHGLVALAARLPTSEHGPRLRAAAYFWQASPDETTGCEVVAAFEGCEVSLCVPVEAAAVPLPGFAWLSAGVVDVFGTKLDFSFTEKERGDYEAMLPTMEMSLWEGGEPLTVAVAGSRDFPPLDVSLTAPRPVVVTAPGRAPGAQKVDPLSDLPVEWSSPSVDSVYVEVEELRAAPYPPPREPSVRCEFPAAAGRGVIPAGVFAWFSDPELLHGYRFRVSTDSRAELDVNGAGFEFVALSEAETFELPVRHGSASKDE